MVGGAAGRRLATAVPAGATPATANASATKVRVVREDMHRCCSGRAPRHRTPRCRSLPTVAGAPRHPGGLAPLSVASEHGPEALRRAHVSQDRGCPLGGALPHAVVL